MSDERSPSAPANPPYDPLPAAAGERAPTRRNFLKASAAAAGASLLSSCIGGGGGGDDVPPLPEIGPLRWPKPAA